VNLEIEECRNSYESGFLNGWTESQRRILALIERCPRTDDDRTIDAPTLIELIEGEK
jgi:hypothetical protein